MPYIHVTNPTAGIDTSKPPFHFTSPDGIGLRGTDYAKGVILRNGEVRSDFGFVNFPTPGLTATNFLHGIFMKAEQFKKLDGSTHTLALTTTNAYHYNTSTTTWDVVTRGLLLDNAESAWTASANVTATNDATIKLRDTTSVKMALAAGFTTGVVAYRNQGPTDATGNTALHFWIYSSIALAAADYSVRVSEQNAGGSGASYTDFNLPAIAATTWTPCCVDGDFSALNAVLSIAVVGVVDKGAHNLYIDDVRAVVRFTGDADNRFSTTMYNNIDIITNGVDQPQKYDGTPATGLTSLTTTLNVGSLTTSEIVLIMKDHVVFMNNTENGVYVPQRVTWGNVGQTTDYVGGTAGYQDLVDDSDWIIAAVPLTDDTTAIYKENSIVHMVWIGGQTPFRFTTVYQGDGAAGKECVFNVGGVHSVLGNKYLYAYNGSGSIVQIDEKINKSFYDSINTLYINRSIVSYDKGVSELQFYIPTLGTTPDDIWVQNSLDSEHPWYRKTRSISGLGFTTTQSTITIGDLVGTIGDQNLRIGDYLNLSNQFFQLVGDASGYVYKITQTTYDNAGVAVTNEFQTPDFTQPVTSSLLSSKNSNEGEISDFFRVNQLLFESKGTSITTEYSIDGGSSWNPTQGNATNVTALTSDYTLYQQDFDVTCRKIRFRYRNVTVSSGYFLRYYAFKFTPRSTRR